jgi:acetyl-CoA hydrolase
MPWTLTEELVNHAEKIGPIRVFLGSVFVPAFDPERTPNFSYVGIGGVGEGAAILTKAGRMDVVTSSIGTLANLFNTGTLQADVVLLQLSAPWNETSTVGLCNDYAIDAARHARTVVAEVNEQMPWVAGAECPADLRIDATIKVSRPPVGISPAKIGEVERSIAGRVAELIPDAATIQTGIGSIPDAIVTALSHHKRLGVHSGMVSDRIVELIQKGVVTNEAKPIDTGLTVVNAVLGTDVSYRFVDRNHAVRMYHSSYTHSLRTLAQIPDFIAINSAIEVDLTGQVNAEIANGSYLGAVGGQPDFVRGALVAPRGKSIIALPSTARGGDVSRIVSDLSGGIASNPRSDADYIVTEWGVAELRGKTLAERARLMVQLAAPPFREDLERIAHQRFRAP